MAVTDSRCKLCTVIGENPKGQGRSKFCVFMCRFIYSVERLTSFHTSIIDTLRAPLLNALAQVTGMLQALLLDVLQRRAAKLPDLMPDVRPVLPTLLASHNHALQNNALKLVKVLLPGETEDAAGESSFASVPRCYQGQSVDLPTAEDFTSQAKLACLD